MAEEQLPNILTHIDPRDLANALVSAWRSIFNEAPKRESILVILAQSALETGRWRYCHAWNIGNIKHVPGDGRGFTYYRCNEVEHGKVVWYDPPNPACAFRAFRTLEEGAVDHLAFLRKRFAAAWHAVELGDPRVFVQQLKAHGYFTADEKPYENSVASIFHEYDGGLQFEVKPDDAPLDEDTKARVMGLVALSLSEIGRADFARETDPDNQNA